LSARPVQKAPTSGLATHKSRSSPDASGVGPNDTRRQKPQDRGRGIALGLAIFATALLSGVFGMAGGLVFSWVLIRGVGLACIARGVARALQP
jgi:hypothetical protein